MSNEEKSKTQPGISSLQRETSSEKGQPDLETQIKAIREGHTTGGYCDTEELHKKEKQLFRILTAALEEAEKDREHERVRILKRRIEALSFRPKLVVAENQ